MTPRRRIWSELVPLAELSASPALGALARRDIGLLAAVQPGDVEHAVALVERARQLDLSIGLWPLLEDARGRWLHPGNAGAFVGWIETLLDALDRRGLSVDTVALDLEPPIDEVRRIADGRFGAARAWLTRELEGQPHRRVVGSLRARGVEVIAAVVPWIALPGRASRGWQRALGAPVDEVPYDAVSAMAYTTLMEGYSFGALRREDARAMLAWLARAAKARFGARAALSLGAVGVGALGDEQRYRDPVELAEDVASARAAGVEDLALFDLAGVLARPPIERWLDALVDTPPAVSETPRTARARAALGAVAVTGVALDLARR